MFVLRFSHLPRYLSVIVTLPLFRGTLRQDPIDEFTQGDRCALALHFFVARTFHLLYQLRLLVMWSVRHHPSCQLVVGHPLRSTLRTNGLLI